MRGPQKWTEESIAARFKAGKGRGEQEGYKPWLTVQDFSSTGTQTRIPSLALNRSIHTFSYIERAMYLVHEYEPGLVDYREQYPMDRRVTLGAAHALRIKHPIYPRSRIPVVMTLDALVTRRGELGATEVSGWDAKPKAELQKKRVQEKLSLHRAYCMHHGFRHVIFTEDSVPKHVVRNLTWLRAALPKTLESDESAYLLAQHVEQMLDELERKTPNLNIASYCHAYDQKRALPDGTALRIYKCLAWQKVLHIDLDAVQVLHQKVSRPNAKAARALKGEVAQ